MKKEKIIGKAPLERIILEKGETIKGYKIMDKDWTWRNHKYKTGETYHYEGEILFCACEHSPNGCGLHFAQCMRPKPQNNSGYDFCLNVVDCFRDGDYEDFIIVEVEAWGEVIKISTMLSAEYISIGNEFESKSIEDLYKYADGNSCNYNSGNCNTSNFNSGNYNSDGCNSGDCNTGYGNSGDHNSGGNNSGDRNSGYGNSGDNNSGNYNSEEYNSGEYNSGGYNSGDYNSGDYNSGNNNSGNNNSGDYNSGDGNSGDGNTADYSSGVFCTEPQKILIFDEPTEITMEEWYCHKARDICGKAFKDGIDSLDEEDWEILKTIPNWDKDKFILCIKTYDLRRYFSSEEWYCHEARDICGKVLKNGIDSLDEEDWETLKAMPHLNMDKFLLCIKSNDLTPKISNEEC